MIGHPRFEYQEISSTNDVAKAAILHGVEEGAVFVAAHQTAGRGRRGTSWNDDAGESVLLTVVLYPKLPMKDVWRLGWISCLAVIDALAASGIRSACKWPNDVVVGSNKIAGILIETVPLANNGYAALLGIGVNVGQRQFDPAVRYRIPPTSMQLELNGEPPPVSVVSTSICKSLDALYMAGGGNIEDINGRYGAALVTGERQSGIDAVTGERLTGTLKQVRFTDGTAGLEIAGGHLRYAFPDGFGE